MLTTELDCTKSTLFYLLYGYAPTAAHVFIIIIIFGSTCIGQLQLNGKENSSFFLSIKNQGAHMKKSWSKHWVISLNNDVLDPNQIPRSHDCKNLCFNTANQSKSKFKEIIRVPFPMDKLWIFFFFFASSHS